jgi:succinyl-diaminopimelate desuccinylase
VYREKIEAYFADKEAELVAAASRLIAIQSVAGEAKPGMPFGMGPARALDEALNIAAEFGLAAKSVDGYVGVADLNDKDTALHILTHLDVVDAGTGWTVTEPFVPKLTGGLLYGRGADDDKGPAAAALFALRAVKELGIPLSHNARLILGTDEECGFRDIEYYYSRHPYAPYTFSPDAGFPLIHIEKGHYRPAFSRAWEPETVLPRVTALRGGIRLNVVPSEAEAVAAGLTASQLKPFCGRAAEETGASFTLTEQAEGVRILSSGSGGHAAEPDKANNALTALLRLLASLPLSDCGSTRALHALSTLFPHGDNRGRALGIAQSDELSGPLTVAFTLLTMEGRGLEGRFDSRTALCANEENCRLAAERALRKHGFTVTGSAEMKPPHHTPADSPFVKNLLGCYEEYTGNKGECIAIGGGTYVHDIPGGVAFGCSIPGFESNMHGPDERARIADLMLSCKIFTQAILQLCM